MRRVNKLSALAVARAARPGYYGDGDGLLLQVSASGTKSWIFRYKRNGRHKEMGLGSLRLVDLAGARAKARECRNLLLAGRDPLEERRQAQRAEAAKFTTFDQCAAAYIAAHRAAWKNPKHVGQWQATLAQYASPIIGELPVATVDTGLVVKVLSPIWHTKTETAKRLRGRIEAILDWATVSQLREGENPARWRGHLDQLLPKPTRIAPVKNFAALPWKEIPEFMRALRSREGTAARAGIRDPDRCAFWGGARGHLVGDRPYFTIVDRARGAHEGRRRTPGAAIARFACIAPYSTAARRAGVRRTQGGRAAVRYEPDRGAATDGTRRYHCPWVSFLLP
jgi:hypothetical protein